MERNFIKNFDAILSTYSLLNRANPNGSFDPFIVTTLQIIGSR